jgi:hypothetical protein
MRRLDTLSRHEVLGLELNIGPRHPPNGSQSCALSCCRCLRWVFFTTLVLIGRGAFAEDAPAGSYECWYFSTPQPLQNFNLKGASYSDSSGAGGSVTSSGGKMTFSWGNLDGQTALYKGGNPPTIRFINANGEEQFFCQLAQ